MNWIASNQSEPGLLLKQLASVPTLYQAWRKVRANRGAAGIDAISLQAFEKSLNANLAELARNLLNRTYEPMPARYVSIPKQNGKQRELAIPTVRDRVAQRAVLDLIEPLFESQFLDCSFAFRPGRSVAMAIQRIVVARANGFNWTVDADIQDFFPSIDHRLLIDDISHSMDEADLLYLIKQWLDAGVLDGARPSARWIERWRCSLASAGISVRDGVNSLLDGFLSERLGAMPDSDFADEFSEESQLPDDTGASTPSRNQFKRAARRLVEDGLLLALSQRAVLKGALNAKVIGIGGAAVLLAAAAPLAARKLSELASHRTGALQGAPISPLLSNIYLHSFDLTLAGQGYRLVRYCDDFVIACRTEADARQALHFAESSLRDRRLRLNLEKTRLLAPAEPLDFLGYRFEADGRVIAPPSVPEAVALQVVRVADRYRSRASARASETTQKAVGLIGRVKDRLRKK